jgi:hypothetical protein
LRYGECVSASKIRKKSFVSASVTRPVKTSKSPRHIGKLPILEKLDVGKSARRVPTAKGKFAMNGADDVDVTDEKGEERSPSREEMRLVRRCVRRFLPLGSLSSFFLVSDGSRDTP